MHLKPKYVYINMYLFLFKYVIKDTRYLCKKKIDF